VLLGPGGLTGYKSISICLLLVALTAAAYWQVRDHQFFTCDDDMYVHGSPACQNHRHQVGLTGCRPNWLFAPGGNLRGLSLWNRCCT
jgi:hypothetical protein